MQKSDHIQKSGFCLFCGHTGKYFRATFPETPPSKPLQVSGPEHAPDLGAEIPGFPDLTPRKEGRMETIHTSKHHLTSFFLYLALLLPSSPFHSFHLRPAVYAHFSPTEREGAWMQDTGKCLNQDNSKLSSIK